MIILNLGAGKKLRSECVNVDIMQYPGIDRVVDLSIFPWPWRSNSISGIHASHIMEHFPDQMQFIRECHRVLKPGGFLRIVGPHASCITSVGCLGHYRTYAYSTLHDYLAEPFYMFKSPLFKTNYQQLNWWYEVPNAAGNTPKWMIPIIKLTNKCINSLIRLVTPQVWENVFSGFIQTREVIWSGEKI